MRTDSSVIEPTVASLVVSAKIAGTNNPISASVSSAALADASFELKVWVPWRRPPIRTLAPRTSKQVADDRARQRRLDDFDEAGLEGEEGDDELGDVAERRVEDPADLRACERPESLRGQPDDPRQTEDRGCRHDEQHRLICV